MRRCSASWAPSCSSLPRRRRREKTMTTSGMRTLLFAHHHSQPINPPYLRAPFIFRSQCHYHPNASPQGPIFAAALHHGSLIHAKNPVLGFLLSPSSSSSSSSSWKKFPDSPFSSLSSPPSSSSPPRLRRIRSSTGSSKPKTKKPIANGKASTPKKKPVQKLVRDPILSVPVILEDSTNLNPELEVLLERLENDGPLAVKLAMDGREDVPPCDTVELSVVICNDEYIQKLNKEWRGKDSPTDVLSFPQDQPPGMSSILLLGDIIISLDTATEQAKERGHSVHDELRILLVHGVLHVLGYDHETGKEDAADMEKEELRILQTLGWNSKGLISAATDESLVDADSNPMNMNYSQEHVKQNGVGLKRSPFRVLLCDMDGTLLNSKSRITEKTAAALKAAIARGVKVIVATGKTRPAVITACQSVGLYGVNGMVSESSPGVFCQGLLVYGEEGQIVHNQHLNPTVCLKAFQYSLDHNLPLLGFSGDRTVTLFEHPLIEELHTVYMEPKADVAPSLEYLIKNYSMQKVLFADTVERIANVIRPYWSQETKNLARVVQAQADMLEIIPLDSSKGKGVGLLLEHLEVSPVEVMAIGDGENDIEMLQLVGWGVAMANGARKTLDVANAKVASNDDDGVVEAIERFILT